MSTNFALFITLTLYALPGLVVGFTLPELALMTLLGVTAWCIGGLLIAVVVTRLSPLRGTACWLIMSGLGSSLPYGPWNFAAVWIVLRLV